MTGFPPHVRSAIEQFAATMNLPARPAVDGSYSFRFSRSGTLTITPSDAGERIFVSLSRKGDEPTRDEAMALLLRCAGFDATTGKFMHSCVDEDGSLINAFEFNEHEIELPTLDLAVRRLIEAQDA